MIDVQKAREKVEARAGKRGNADTCLLRELCDEVERLRTGLERIAESKTRDIHVELAEAVVLRGASLPPASQEWKAVHRKETDA